MTESRKIVVTQPYAVYSIHTHMSMNDTRKYNTNDTKRTRFIHKSFVCVAHRFGPSIRKEDCARARMLVFFHELGNSGLRSPRCELPLLLQRLLPFMWSHVTLCAMSAHTQMLTMCFRYKALVMWITLCKELVQCVCAWVGVRVREVHSHLCPRAHHGSNTNVVHSIGPDE